MTLDIEMPRMDGLTALQKIMAENPMPVIMVSSLTTEGAESTLKALDLGAVDFIPKDKSFASFGVMKIEDQLISKIKNFAKRKMFFQKTNDKQNGGKTFCNCGTGSPHNKKTRTEYHFKEETGYYRNFHRRTSVPAESYPYAPK